MPYPPDRRFAVPFDPAFFARRAQAGDAASAEAAFRHAHAVNHWMGAESPSGPGSSLDQTAVLRRALPGLCRRLGVRTLLDLPCGDGHWMSLTDLGPVRYIGADLLPEIVEACAARGGQAGREFRVLDLLTAPLPDADLLLCRDCLVHLSFADVARAIANIRRARVTWLLATTFTEQRVNEDIQTGDWRPLSLQAPPFAWPAPEEVLTEQCTEAEGRFADKSLGLWRVDSLPGHR